MRTIAICLITVQLSAAGMAVAADGPIAESLAREARVLAAQATVAASMSVSTRASSVSKTAVTPKNASLSSLIRYRGKSVEVIDRDGSTVRGRLVDASDAVLVLDNDGLEVAIPRYRITRVEITGDLRTAGAVLGAVAGLLVGVLDPFKGEHPNQSTPGAMVVGTAIVTGIGLWIGSRHQTVIVGYEDR